MAGDGALLLCTVVLIMMDDHHYLGGIDDVDDEMMDSMFDLSVYLSDVDDDSRPLVQQ